LPSSRSEKAYVASYDHEGKRHHLIVPGANLLDAQQKLKSLQANGKITGECLGEINADRKLLQRLFPD
jgi:hypothetical protein